MPHYYIDAIQVWREIKYEQIETWKQCIWYNKNIRLGSKTVYNGNLFKCGMWTINDLYENGTLVNFMTWHNRGALVKDMLVWQGIISAIRKQWKDYPIAGDQQVFDGVLPYACFNNSAISLMSLTQKQVKDFYRLLVYNKLDKNDFKAKCKYAQDGFRFSEENWKKIYTLPNNLLKNNKVFDLQFQILHRIVPTNKWLYMVKKVCSPRCSFCGMCMESIEHLCFLCPVVRSLWTRLFEKMESFHEIKL